jgi:hypothetical protein
MPSITQLRRFRFTLNNYTQEDLDALVCRPFAQGNRVTYICYGLENAPTTGTPHVQGYLEVEKKTTFTGIQHYCTAAYQRADTPWDTCKAYCFKTRPGDESNTVVYEEGTPMRQGQRNDLNAIGEQIVGGVRPEAIAEENPGMYARYHRGLHALRAAVIDRPRDQATPKNVVVLFGPTGTGKTRTAIERLTELYGSYYLWDPTLHPWWDGYDCHRGVVIDEFRGQLPFSVILRLLDRYRMTVQVKGGMRQFVADTIYITSPKHPDEWYKDDGSDKLNQLKRRITTVELKDTPLA